MPALDRIAADIAARTGARGAELAALVAAAGYIMAAMTENDAAAAHFAALYEQKSQGG
jgi:hypothetical protein